MALVALETICRELGLDPATVRHWVDLGLVELEEQGGITGFAPLAARRIWSIASLVRDLDVNLEGARIILELTDELRELKSALWQAARRMESQRHASDFRLQVIEHYLGAAEWDIDL